MAFFFFVSQHVSFVAVQLHTSALEGITLHIYTYTQLASIQSDAGTRTQSLAGLLTPSFMLQRSVFASCASPYSPSLARVFSVCFTVGWANINSLDSGS